MLFRPNLVSLDLSYNNFTDLLSLLSNLVTLKKLRILVLQGNPLALLPGYRGFTIDSLPKLCALDDILITPDERHGFVGLVKNPGKIYSLKETCGYKFKSPKYPKYNRE